MNNPPQDIVQLKGNYIMQCGSYYYMKKITTRSPVEFYFRVSVSECYNDTAVLLCDCCGEFIKDPSLIDQDAMQAQYKDYRLWEDGRISIYNDLHTDKVRAIWAVSDNYEAYRNYANFNRGAFLPEKLHNFWKKMSDLTTIEEFKATFIADFQPGLDLYEQYHMVCSCTERVGR
jgi:hypothetical protein